jgi:hypothetical protein
MTPCVPRATSSARGTSGPACADHATSRWAPACSFSTRKRVCHLSDLYFERADVHYAELRAACAAMGEAVAELASTSIVRARWDDLIKLLALSPKRELRRCPKCNGVAMSDATRCMECWSELAPVTAG